MVEMHGWITLRDTYEDTDEDKTKTIVDDINSKIKEYGYYDLEATWMNGECCLQFALYTNHWGQQNQDYLDIYHYIAGKAAGSYGLLYVHDDEAKNDGNSFVVYKLIRGKVERVVDDMLSPYIPTVEDN